MGKGKRKGKRRNIMFTMLEGKGKSADKKEGMEMRMGMGRAKNTISKTLYERVATRGENQGKFFSQGFYRR